MWNIVVDRDKLVIAAGLDGLVILKIRTPSRFLNGGALLSDGSFTLQWTGGDGTVTLETSADLDQWEPIATQPASSGTVTWIRPSGEFSPRARFYRMVDSP